ncbi:MAG: hypothetical protein K0S68_239 [Candidatus Saccharibacteria bacterium]|jgi:hypothetical protein|nr:hypothetical protein [Candidatus Saccharibacteria bacterium]
MGTLTPVDPWTVGDRFGNVDDDGSGMDACPVADSSPSDSDAMSDPMATAADLFRKGIRGGPVPTKA